ncbi:hypothetical protein IB691_02130 [Fangia hongkongensis]|nr:hypothetical protein [Fangia hongkongensis]
MDGRFVKVDEICTLDDGGKRVNFHYLGDVFSSELKGTCRGIDYAIIYSDRVNIHVHEVISLSTGEKISIERNATGAIDTNGIILVNDDHCCIKMTENKVISNLKGARLYWKAQLANSSRNFFVEVYYE